MECRGLEAKAAVRVAFEGLGEFDIADDRFDAAFARLVTAAVRRAEQERIEQPDLDSDLTEEEVQLAISKLKKGKSAGVDDIISEWLMYGGERMNQALWVLLSQAWRSEVAPSDWSKGLISPIYKDGDHRDALNYRGITLLSVIGKLYTSVINERLMVWCADGEVLSDEQGGFKRFRGCTEQIFILSEVIKLRKKNPTFTMFIDVKKAFDGVFRDGLWIRLWEAGVRGKIWRVIKQLYSDVESSVKTGAGYTEWFKLHNGVRQGCPLSPTLYNIFIDGLVRKLKSLGLGVQVDGNGRLCCLLYADDIVLIASSQADMEALYAAVEEYGHKWRFELNYRKTMTVEFSGIRAIPTLPAGADEDDFITASSFYKYLGLIFQSRGTWRMAKEQMIRRANKAMVWSYNGLVRQGNMTVKGLQNVWTALVRPYLEYGAEVWPSRRDQVWNEAELIQRKMARRILKCSKKTPAEVLQGELGWVSLAGRRAMLRLFFWARILELGRHTWVRRLYNAGRQQLVANPQSNSWSKLTRDLLRQLGLGQYWDTQQLPDMEVWRERVRTLVLNRDEAKWRYRMLSKPKLSDYSRWKTKLELEPYLLYRDPVARRALARLRSTTHELRVETGRWEKVHSQGKAYKPTRQERLCRQCYRETEDETHFLLRCPVYARSRDQLILQVDMASPLPLDRLHVLVMRREQTLDGPSDFDCYRTVAWLMAEERVKHTLQFVKAAFSTRRKIMRLTEV